MEISPPAASGPDVAVTAGGGALETVRGALEKALGWLCCALLTGMVLVVFANVVARYWLDASIGWSEEVSRFMFIWLAFLGSVLAFRKGEHLGLDLLVKSLPRAGSNAVLLASDVLVILALAYMTWGGVDMTSDSLASGWVSSAVPIPYGYVYLVVPVSFGLMLLECLLKTVLDLRRTFGSGHEVRPC